jgi:hypothetical protein
VPIDESIAFLTTAATLSALALEIEPHFAEEARKRQEASQLRGRTDDGEPLFGGGKCPTTEKAKSRDQAAAAVGVSQVGRSPRLADGIENEIPQ